MSQSIITLAFEQYKAEQEATATPVELNEFVLANIPNQDPSLPIDRAEGLPAAEFIVHVADTSQEGFVNPNAVVYSLIMDTTIGDFEFNWIGLRNKESGVIAAISHVPTVSKFKTIAGVQNGNAVTRSIMMSYFGAQALTNINVDASTWQIDFTARLSGMDERVRLANVDHYGHATFLNDGFEVQKAGSDYSAKIGTGYLGGLRCHSLNAITIADVVPNSGIYLDASYQGQLTSQWQSVFSLTCSETELTDYIDAHNVQHYVTKIADIDGAANVVDTRFIGGTTEFERADNAATDAEIDSESKEKKHVKLPQFWRALAQVFKVRKINTIGPLKGGNNLSVDLNLSIDDATIKQKGAVQLSNALNSSNEKMALTIKAGRDIWNKAVSAYQLAETKITEEDGDNRYRKKGDTGDNDDGALRIDNIDGMQYNPYSVSIAQLKDGRIIVWGQQNNDTTAAAFGCGYTTHGGANISGYKVVPLPRKVWKKYGIYGWCGFALSEDGELYTWGGNNGQPSTIGQPAPHWSNLPKLVIGGVKDIVVSKFSTYSIYHHHTVLIMNDNSFRYFGFNNSGQAQNDLLTPIYTPIDWTAPSGESFATLKELVSIGNHAHWFLWVGNNGRHYAIGDNTHGQFGDGTRTSSKVWKELTWLRGKVIDQVVGGSLYYSTVSAGDKWMAIRSGHSIWYTGLNSSGVNGAEPSVNTPIQMPDASEQIYSFGGGVATIFSQVSNRMFARGYGGQGQTGTLTTRTNEWHDITPDGIYPFNPKFYTTTHGHTYGHYSNAFAVITGNGIDRLFVIGSNQYGSCGLGYHGTRPKVGGMFEVLHPFRSPIKDIITNGYGGGPYSFVLLENGELWGCGYGGRYNLSGVFSGYLSSESTYVFRRLF